MEDVYEFQLAIIPEKAKTRRMGWCWHFAQKMALCLLQCLQVHAMHGASAVSSFATYENQLLLDSMDDDDFDWDELLWTDRDSHIYLYIMQIVGTDVKYILV